jgi:hypothetical protein
MASLVLWRRTFLSLNCSRNYPRLLPVSSSEAKKRLRQYGPNEIAEKKCSSVLVFLRFSADRFHG